MTIIIGIDQSYTETAITVMVDGEARGIYTVTKQQDNYVHRDMLKTLLYRIYDMLIDKAPPHVKICCICERTRLRSGAGNKRSNKEENSKDGFISKLSMQYMIELTTIIADAGHRYMIPTYTVDTRSWKSAIVGSSKPLDNILGIDPKKYRTIKYVNEQLLNSRLYDKIFTEVGSRCTVGVVREHLDTGKKFRYDDNVCDSYCIAQYGFLPKIKQKLELID